MQIIQSHLSRLFISTIHFTSRPTFHMFRRLQFAGNMSGWSNSQQPRNRSKTVGHGDSKNGYTGYNGRHSNVERAKNVPKDVLEDPKPFPSPKAEYDNNYPPLAPSVPNYSKSKKKTKVDLANDPHHSVAQISLPTCIDDSSVGQGSIKEAESSLETLPASFGDKQSSSPTKGSKFYKISSENSGKPDLVSKSLSVPEPDRICPSSKEGKEGNMPMTCSFEHEATLDGNQTTKDDEALLPAGSGKKRPDSHAGLPKIPQTKVDLGNYDQFKEQGPQSEASSVRNQTVKEESLSELSIGSFVKEQCDSPTKRHKTDQTSSENLQKTNSTDSSLSSPEPSDMCYSAEEEKAISVTATHSFEHEAAPVGNQTIKDDEASLPKSFGKKWRDSPAGTSKIRQTSSVDHGKSDSSKGLPSPTQFHICYPARQEIEGRVLGPGMVLLKKFISLYDQIKIVKKCEELGEGPGGFYQPGYNDGAKLRLQMMCLGQDWDPQTRAYGKRRAFDGSEPLAIPADFELLVKRAIQDSQALTGKDLLPSDNVENILPSMSPDICIVNFYPTHGRLGLHQDRDESKESLKRGLPVVSFSIGDSAEFLYSDWRDADSAESVVLESGDVLVFGGKSRHIFHGVSHIIQKSAPRALWEVLKMKHGRLNLTFRQY